MKPILLLLSLGLFALPAHARLGETVAEIDKRYGSRIATNHIDDLVIYTYHFKEYSVAVTFLDSKSVFEKITALPPRYLSDEECESLFKNVGREGQWTKVPESDPNNLKTLWVRSEDNTSATRACVDPQKSIWELTIMTTDYNLHLSERRKQANEAQRKKDKAKADGF
jgi:hypothetical protein